MSHAISHGRSIQHAAAVPPLRTIAMILAQGVIRLHQRQKALDNFTEQSVHSDADRQALLLAATKRKTNHGDINVLNT